MSTERFVVKGINHIGLAPKDPLKARWFFETLLQLGHLGDELVKSQETLTVMMRSVSATAKDKDEPRLEILAPEDGKGPIAKFLEKKGSGVHHLALTVDNIAAAIAALLAANVKMIDEAPRDGAHHTRIAFVHPESTGGLLIELVQEG